MASIEFVGGDELHEVKFLVHTPDVAGVQGLTLGVNLNRIN